MYDSETRLNQGRRNNRERWASAEEVYHYTRSERYKNSPNMNKRYGNQNDSYGGRGYNNQDYYQGKILFFHCGG